MFGAQTEERPQRIGFLLVPDFSMVAFMSAVEPLRLANWVRGEELYAWRVLSADGAPVRASAGIVVSADAAISDHEVLPTTIVCSGIEVQHYEDKAVFAWLRKLDRRGVDIGALCTGTQVLARAGLLDGRRCTIHWENLPGFAEAFPNIEVSTELFEIDGNRFTCSGGTAALDMMLSMISSQHGRALALAVSDELINDHIREHDDHSAGPSGPQPSELIISPTRLPNTNASGPKAVPSGPCCRMSSSKEAPPQTDDGMCYDSRLTAPENR